jgi:HK97 family phage prohead protease
MADWDTAYVNDLPDSAFLLIEPGGKKDREGKTVPRELRHFPVRNAAGEVDAPHLRNALARIPQASTLSAAQRQTAMDKAKALAKASNVSGAAGSYEGSAGSGRSRAVTIPDEFMGLQTRSFELVLELRSDGDGRTLVGRAVPYNQTISIDKGRAQERFVMGAFQRQIDSGHVGPIKLYDSHQARINGEQPVGKTEHLSELQDGLHGVWPLYSTTRANDALELVRSGEVTGLSIGFKALPGGTRRAPDGAYERRVAHLDHVVLTHEPAYAGAVVTAVRSAGPSRASFDAERRKHERILDLLAAPL